MNESLLQLHNEDLRSALTTFFAASARHDDDAETPLSDHALAEDMAVAALKAVDFDAVKRKWFPWDGVRNVPCSVDAVTYERDGTYLVEFKCGKGRALGRGAKTTICCTRYGNVMCSRGSVIPLFIDQMRANKPITVTDPNMTRFMMTLDEAVDLVVYAFQHGENGDLFVQKAPAATIDTLAHAVLKLYGREDLPINVIGTRHGEKVYETLVTREEMAKAVDMGRYYRVPADVRDLNYDKYLDVGDHKVTQAVEFHSHNTTRLDVDGMVELLKTVRYIREDLGLK